MFRNKVLLVGRLTKDIELKKTTSGKSVCNFSLAVQKTKDEAIFVNCVAWEQVATTLSQFTHKGSKVGIEGRIDVRSYEAPEGGKRVLTEVIVETIELLDPKQQTTDNVETYVEPTFSISDDELPF